MNYEVGQTLVWIPASQHEKHCPTVTVTGLRKRGHAMLSNGWVVDEDGRAEGTSRQPGGHVEVP